MIDNQQKEYDAVLGGQLQVPANGVVLGGIKAVKKRLAQDPIKPKLAALKEALKYGDAGLDLIIEALRHQPPQVKQLAYTLLCQHPDEKAKQSIEKCNQYHFFQCLDALEGHKSEVVWVRFCSNGKKFISVSKDATIKVWDLTTEKVIQNIETDISKHRVATKYDKMHMTIALSSDETTICCVTDHNPNIEVWNLDTGSKIYTLKGHSDGKNEEAGALAISADGQILFSSSGDRCIKVWDVQTGNLLGSFKVEVAINFFCLSPDGKTLFSGTCEKVILWNWQKGEVIKTLKLNPVEYNSYFSNIKIWSIETGELVDTCEGLLCFVDAVKVSPDGQAICSGRDKHGDTSMCFYVSKPTLFGKN